MKVYTSTTSHTFHPAAPRPLDVHMHAVVVCTATGVLGREVQALLGGLKRPGSTLETARRIPRFQAPGFQLGACTPTTWYTKSGLWCGKKGTWNIPIRHAVQSVAAVKHCDEGAIPPRRATSKPMTLSHKCYTSLLLHVP